MIARRQGRVEEQISFLCMQQLADKGCILVGHLSDTNFSQADWKSLLKVRYLVVSEMGLDD